MSRLFEPFWPFGVPAHDPAVDRVPAVEAGHEDERALVPVVGPDDQAIRVTRRRSDFVRAVTPDVAFTSEGVDGARPVDVPRLGDGALPERPLDVNLPERLVTGPVRGLRTPLQ